MQLFILDREPTVAVQCLSDCHVRKMCLETAQILSSVMCLNHYDSLEDMPKPYNPKHPVIQAIKTPSQINWVLHYNDALQEEYEYRFGKEHAYWGIRFDYNVMYNLYPFPSVKSPEGLARDFKDFTTDKTDIVEAHRDYYRHKKTIIKNWAYTNRKEPGWLV